MVGRTQREESEESIDMTLIASCGETWKPRNGSVGRQDEDGGGGGGTQRLGRQATIAPWSGAIDLPDDVPSVEITTAKPEH